MTLHKMVNGVRIDLTPEEEAAVRAEWAKNEAEAKANAWLEGRKREYPSINDQLDMLWHDIQDGVVLHSGSWYTSVEAIKDKYPKPQE